MEQQLNLESFVDPSDDEEEKQEESSLPLRTVDEILRLNDSSSSSGSPSPPSSPSSSTLEFSRFSSSISTSKTLLHHSHSTKSDEEEAPRLPHSISLDSNFNNITQTRIIPNPQFSSSRAQSTSLLPPLFSAVRSNAKPGAALAAAAAASRSIPAPRAAAIKSSRTTTPSAISRVLDDDSQETTTADSTADAAAAGQFDDKLYADSEYSSSRRVEEKQQQQQQQEIIQKTPRDDGSGQFSATDDHIEVPEQNFDDPKVNEERFDDSRQVYSAVPTHFDSPAQIERKELDFEEKSAAASIIVESEGEKFQSSSLQDEDNHHNDHDDSEFSYANETTRPEEIIPVADSGDGKTLDTMHDQDNIISQSKDEDDLSLREDDDPSSEDDIAEIVQDVASRWESNKGDRKTRKKKLQPSFKKPIELAEELEKRQAFTGMNLEEGAAAQPMRLEGVRRGSTVLGYFDVDANNVVTRTISSQAFRREHGFPMVLAVHLNYIAVGMSKGVIVVTPSKYSSYHSDNMDSKMSMLGLQGDRAYVPVTSMCFNQQGDLIFAGYGDGHCSVWDVQKASALKVISEHKAPVVHMLYLGQDAQVTRQFSIITGDSKGVVKLVQFSVVPWVNRISYSKAMKLLDETNSTVICASPLLSGDFLGGAPVSSQGSSTVSTSTIGSMMGGVIGGNSGWKNASLAEEGVVIFVTHQSGLVAKVSPSVEVYAKIPKPDGVSEGSMPYAAWKYMSEPHLSSTENLPVEASEKFALLAIAWDRKVQVAKLVKSELKVYGKWTLDNPAAGVAWLDDQMLVVLTSGGQLCLFAKDGNMIHQTSYAVDGSRGDDLISYHTYFNNSYGNPEKAHHNCLAVRGASIYILGPSHLVVSRLLPWKERIEVLRRAGDWMGALYMAMTLYDGQAHGVVDLPRTLDDIQTTVMPYLAELLMSYVDEGFSYIKVASGNQVGHADQSDEPNNGSGYDYPDIKEQYTRVGGVAVEFCVHIKRTDILFDEIFSKFCAAKHKETFLELLEPYILKDMLGSLPPEIMQALVEHYSMKGWLQRVEQCVLHMDISSLDFNQVIRLCREHALHGALIYLFNKGLDDFRTPLEELLVVLRTCQRESAAILGYRMLVYLKYCFQGLAFPPGLGTLSRARLPSIRKELIQFLLEDSNAPNSGTAMNLPSNGPYVNLCHLLELDTEASLDVLHCAFEDDETPKLNNLSEELPNSNLDLTEVKDIGVERQNLVQELVDVLSVILDMSYFQRGSSTSSDDGSLVETWPSKKDAAHIFEFIAYYVACERANISQDILSQILEYLTSEFSLLSCLNIEISERREKQLLSLLEVVPQTDWDAPYLLQLCEKAQFHQVCGFIHDIRYQYFASLDSYMKAADEPIHAFSFIHDKLQHLSDKELDAFRAEVMSRIPGLFKLNREGAFFLVIGHFYGQSQHTLLSELQSHPESFFLYLKTLIEVHSTGGLDFSCLRKDSVLDNPSGKKVRHQSDRVKAYLEALSDFPKILRNNPIHVTDEMTELYLELLCRYDRKSVLKFLETLESYRVENCLRLCQEYGIVDAAAFLLERVGEVGSALSLILSGLNDKFVTLDSAILGDVSDSGPQHVNAALKKKEVEDLLEIVHSCIGLCQRNSPRLDSHESEYLWFQLLDSFCEPLIDSHSRGTRYMAEKHMGILDDSFHTQKDEEEYRITWKISKSHKGAHMLRKLLSVFIKEIVEGMIGYVRLPTIMLKLLSDNSGQEFGDFKLTILGMLGTYDFERRILDTAKSLIEDDTYYTMSLLKKGASHGYAPRSLLCCVCNCLLTKGSHGSSIRVFSCGHAMHVHCELHENETSVGGSSSGCPICVPRERAQRSRSKSMLVENGLVVKASSRSHQAPGTAALHPPDNDVFENFYGSHPISRFELLNNLQKDQRSIQIESMPQLRLAPPALYHEKVKKGIDLMTGESSSVSSKEEKSSRSRQLRDVKVKGSSVRFPLRSNIFGKEKKSKQ